MQFYFYLLLAAILLMVFLASFNTAQVGADLTIVSVPVGVQADPGNGKIIWI